jgi:hypothetical protein
MLKTGDSFLWIFCKNWTKPRLQFSLPRPGGQAGSLEMWNKRIKIPLISGCLRGTLSLLNTFFPLPLIKVKGDTGGWGWNNSHR